MTVTTRPLIPLVAPTITGHDRARMLAAIADGVLEHERHVRMFEEAFAERVGCGWAVAVNSGTSALTIALHALGAAGDEVMVPTYGCVAVPNAVHSLGGKPHYVDATYDVEAAQGTFEWLWPDNAVLVHLFGRPTIMQAPGQILVEDYTLSLGGIPTLTGDVGVCSTHASKMMSTGRGGVIFGNSEPLHEQVRQLAHYEMHTRFGYSAAMSSTQAVLGLSQLEQLDSFIDRRRELAGFYSERFAAAGIECPDPDCGSTFFRYLIGVDDPAAKVALLAEHGIEAGRGVYPPLHRLAGLPDDDFPGACAAVDRLLSVPVHPAVSDAEAAYVAEQVLRVCAPADTWSGGAWTTFRAWNGRREEDGC